MALDKRQLKAEYLNRSLDGGILLMEENQRRKSLNRQTRRKSDENIQTGIKHQ